MSKSFITFNAPKVLYQKYKAQVDKYNQENIGNDPLKKKVNYRDAWIKIMVDVISKGLKDEHLHNK